MDNTILEYVCERIADTDNGATGKKIVDICNRHAIDCVVKIPFNDIDQFRSDYKGDRAPNKRTALLKNLKCFDSEEQRKIILEIIDVTSLSSEQKAEIVQKIDERYPKE